MAKKEFVSKASKAGDLKTAYEAALKEWQKKTKDLILVNRKEPPSKFENLKLKDMSKGGEFYIESDAETLSFCSNINGKKDLHGSAKNVTMKTHDELLKKIYFVEEEIQKKKKLTEHYNGLKVVSCVDMKKNLPKIYAEFWAFAKKEHNDEAIRFIEDVLGGASPIKVYETYIAGSDDWRGIGTATAASAKVEINLGNATRAAIVKEAQKIYENNGKGKIDFTSALKDAETDLGDPKSRFIGKKTDEVKDEIVPLQKELDMLMIEKKKMFS
jgi:hypothetical protein